MSAIKPIIREVKQSVLKGFAHAKDKLHQLADNLTQHVDDVARRVRGQDSYNGPEGNGVPGSGRPDNGADSGRGVDRGDGRDHLGHYANGQENKPWVDKEKLGLENYGNDNDVEVITTQVRVDYPGSPQDGRRYDGLVRNDDGPNTYDGIEIKSGDAIANYTRPGNTQYQFDNAVNDGTPAHGRLDGQDILVTRVIVREEP
ncbi:hypothetical protein [Microbacterium sp. SA39]|uniref:hypothetical protein n=1 Tax=Microbacterium sp. SA39 TaxID=1263625 RepID=UPI0005FA7F0F|nr:hypothetical protein [Microbacterium sp. SA39]KJQ53332.1 hypothetical protein RS85_02846 [Microbacterium sp. SA39]